MIKFSYSSEVPFAVEDLFSYHERKGVIYRLIPPWDEVVVLKEPDNLMSSNAKNQASLR